MPDRMDRRILHSAGLQVFGPGASASGRLEFHDVRVAAAFVTRLVADTRDGHTLRSAAGELLGAPPRGDHDLVAWLAGALVTGRLVLAPPPSKAPHALAVPPDDQPKPKSRDPFLKGGQEEPASTHWIEIQLVGEDGEGIPAQRYRIITPDGVERRGFTDSLGLARVARLPEGQCQISFPDLDADAWEPL